MHCITVFVLEKWGNLRRAECWQSRIMTKPTKRALGGNCSLDILGVCSTLCLRRVESCKFKKSSLKRGNGRCSGCDNITPEEAFWAYLCIQRCAIVVLIGLQMAEISHIGVGSDVVCSTGLGNARALTRGTDNRTVSRFFMSITEFCLE